MKKTAENDTIAALSTPAGSGGIGIIRLSGSRAIDITGRIFKPASGIPLKASPSHRIHYGTIYSPGEKGAEKSTSVECMLDEVLVMIMRAPKTYTREDIVEINCHGGMAVLHNVLDLVSKGGARLAEPGEFTRRAFVNGRIDLTQAEAVDDVINAKTERALALSLGQLKGSVRRAITSLRDTLLTAAADIEARIDFSDEQDVKESAGTISHTLHICEKNITSLLNTYTRGRIIRSGITAVICGRKNAGKSSLMNVLLGRDRVIVTHIPGTTRDAVEELITIQGIPIRLIDTAGLGAGKDAAESKGIAISRDYMRAADIILYVIDGHRRLSPEDTATLSALRGRQAIAVINKSDLTQRACSGVLKRDFPDMPSVTISCKTRTALDKLEQTIYTIVWGTQKDIRKDVILSNARQYYLVQHAHEAIKRTRRAMTKGMPYEIIACELRSAITFLGEITGDSYTDDMLKNIFSRFCIGK